MAFAKKLKLGVNILKKLLPRLQLRHKILFGGFVIVEFSVHFGFAQRGFMVPSPIDLLQTILCFPVGSLSFFMLPHGLLDHAFYYALAALNMYLLIKLTTHKN